MAARACRTAEPRSAAYQEKAESTVCAVPTADHLPHPAPQLERPLPGRDGLPEPVGEVQVDGHRFQQAGAGGGVVADVAQRGLVEGDGLPVRARAGRLRTPPRGRTAGSGGRRRPPPRGGRARSGRRRPTSSASIIAACNAGSEPGTAAPSTADRAISWRNATPRPCRSSRPVPVSTSTVAVATPSAASSSALTGSGVHDSSSRHRRASGASPAVRASTASRTLSGSGDSGWARIWLTKNGLPAVRRWTSAGSSRCPSRSVGDRGPAQRGQLQPARVRRARRGRRGQGGAVGRRRARRGTTAPAAAAAKRSGGRGTARGRASPRPPSAGPRRRTRAGGRAGRRAPRRRSRAGRRCRAAGRGRRCRARARRRAAGRAGGACSASRTCPTAAAPSPASARRGHAGGRSCRCPPRRRRGRRIRGRRRPGERGPRSPRGGARAPAVASSDRRSPNNPRAP